MSSQGPRYGAFLRALRSGEYKPCRDGTLYDDKRHCCMGVGCAVVWGDSDIGERTRGIEPQYWPVQVRRQIILRPSRDEVGRLADSFGIADHSIRSDLDNVLAVANDRKKVTFPEIADAIEAIWGPPEDEL